ncbi:hypothetical protein [Daejeonella sp. H1SJ63]|jgi:hypothetical protein|nr:hypothetical protein [Daejeonella sp. H1SJ63]
MTDYKRDYHFKSGIQRKESRRFWLFILIGLAIGAAILYFFR